MRGNQEIIKLRVRMLLGVIRRGGHRGANRGVGGRTKKFGQSSVTEEPEILWVHIQHDFYFGGQRGKFMQKFMRRSDERSMEESPKERVEE